MKEADAANIILGEAGAGDGFTIKWGILRLKYQIRPITARSLIKISREVCRIKDIDLETAMFPGLMNGAGDMKFVCRSIAIATGTRFPRFVARAISDLPSKDILALWNILVKQSDPSSFFFIIMSARGMNKMKPMNPQVKPEEEIVSSDASQ